MIIKQNIEGLIRSLRGERIILDTDLAHLYGVSTRRLNEQIKRNRKRFPSDFVFQLTKKEKDEGVAKCDPLMKMKISSPSLRSQIATLNSRRGQHRKYSPFAFTEYGAFMAANVLNSKRAVAMSVYVIRAFVKLREAIHVNDLLEKRFAVIEKSLLEHDHALRQLFAHIKPLLLPLPEKPKRRMGFHPL